jgi:hypothetical protein
MLSEYRDSGWVVAPLEKPYGRGMNLQMELMDTGPVYQRLLDNNVALFQDMKDTWRETGDVLSGQREFLVQDPDGYLLRFVSRWKTTPQAVDRPTTALILVAKSKRPSGASVIPKKFTIFRGFTDARKVE